MKTYYVLYLVATSFLTLILLTSIRFAFLIYIFFNMHFTGDLPTLSRLPLEKNIQTGIPGEAFDLECPDLELKASVLQEFILLDQKYVERLDQLEEQHQKATELVYVIRH